MFSTLPGQNGIQQFLQIGGSTVRFFRLCIPRRLLLTQASFVFFWVDSMEVLVLRFSNESDTRNSLRTADLSVKICLYNDPLEFDITGLLLDF